MRWMWAWGTDGDRGREWTRPVLLPVLLASSLFVRPYSLGATSSVRASGHAQPKGSQDGASSTAGWVDYAPGVRIDWQRRRVEVDVKVVLRQGPLELLVCSPGTREHESVFVSPARPLHLYQALGLLGFDPGAPVRYDEARDEWIAPHGASLELSTRCGADADVPVEHYLLQTETEKRPDSLPWVFAGSRKLDENGLAADRDGTVVCLVDFESALITVGAVHTADNEQLWLRANPETIPQMKTPCTLVISERGWGAFPWTLHVQEDATLMRHGESVSVALLLRKLEELSSSTEPPRLRLVPVKGAGEGSIKSAMKRLVAAGVPRNAIHVVSNDNGERE